jgi:hypothetical protein
VHIDEFNVLCLLGKGSYAKVYLVDTTKAICCAPSARSLKALKMLSKESLHMKDYFEYIKDEK